MAVADEMDIHPVTERKKAGDIIVVRPYPWNWGRKEIDQYLIILIESARPPEEIRKLEEPTFWNHNTGSEISRDEWLALNAAAGDDMEALGDVMRMPRAKKNRFKIVIPELQKTIPDLDLARMMDKRAVYQPFKSASQLVAKFTGGKNRYLTKTEVYATMNKAAAEEEFIINIDQAPGLLFDKLRGVIY
jgi:hypothetical protein